MLRTHTCGELRKKHVGKKVKLCGWISHLRNHGRLWFVDLRDRYGKTQIVLKESEGIKELKNLSMESCISVSGKVVFRRKGSEKKEWGTGDVEVFGEGYEIYNKSVVLPFELNDEKVGEEVRMNYRFLDLRNDKLMKNLMLRSKVSKAISDFLIKEDFINIETPILNKSTPEGARDYLVPSRVHVGKFYALPQSPQIMKQLLMISGFDKYFQIAKCFRDEDLRSDRQPEFTQLDIELSFVEEEDIISIMERLWAYVFKEVLGVKIKTPFPRISYDEAMKKYRKDSPDIRKKGSKGKFSFVWVMDFPMFELDEEEKKWKAMHHPFTSPEDNANFNDLKKMKAKAYDLVLNGSEIGGGSVRIHNKETQNKVFGALGLTTKEADEKFGFLTSALSHGAPPMAGIAFGLDRILQIMTGSENIRDVIAFPKNKAGQDVMMDSPSDVTKNQIDDLGLVLKKKSKK